MTDDAELIESLRLWNRDDAADRIEQLVATNETLIAENTKLHHHIEGAAKDTHKIMVGYEAKLAENEVRLRKAVEALLTIVDNGGAGSYHLARAILAEIKSSKAAPPYGLEGESHEVPDR